MVRKVVTWGIVFSLLISIGQADAAANAFAPVDSVVQSVPFSDQALASTPTQFHEGRLPNQPKPIAAMLAKQAGLFNAPPIHDPVQLTPEQLHTYGDLLAARYRPIRFIAEGGYAFVYLAEDTKNSNKKVVVKIAKDHIAAVHHVQQEAHLLSILKGGPGVLNGGEPIEEGLDFSDVLVEDFIDGPDLYSVIDTWNKEGISVGQRLPALLHMADQILETLEFIHEKKLLHNDVKPENILVDSSRAVLTDYGIANPVGEYVEGTREYTPPEIYSEQEAPGPGRDIYALGITLLHAFSAPEVSHFLSLSELESSPRHAVVRMAQILRKATEPKSADRYQTAAEMRKDILALEEETSPSIRNPLGHTSSSATRRGRTALTMLMAIGLFGGYGAQLMHAQSAGTTQPIRAISDSAVVGHPELLDRAAQIVAGQVKGDAGVISTKSLRRVGSVFTFQLQAGDRIFQVTVDEESKQVALDGQVAKEGPIPQDQVLIVLDNGSKLDDAHSNSLHTWARAMNQRLDLNHQIHSIMLRRVQPDIPYSYAAGILTLDVPSGIQLSEDSTMASDLSGKIHESIAKRPVLALFESPVDLHVRAVLDRLNSLPAMKSDLYGAQPEAIKSVPELLADGPQVLNSLLRQIDAKSKAKIDSGLPADMSVVEQLAFALLVRIPKQQRTEWAKATLDDRLYPDEKIRANVLSGVKVLLSDAGLRERGVLRGIVMQGLQDSHPVVQNIAQSIPAQILADPPIRPAAPNRRRRLVKRAGNDSRGLNFEIAVGNDLEQQQKESIQPDVDGVADTWPVKALWNFFTTGIPWKETKSPVFQNIGTFAVIPALEQFVFWAALHYIPALDTQSLVGVGWIAFAGAVFAFVGHLHYFFPIDPATGKRHLDSRAGLRATWPIWVLGVLLLVGGDLLYPKISEMGETLRVGILLSSIPANFNAFRFIMARAVQSHFHPVQFGPYRVVKVLHTLLRDKAEVFLVKDTRNASSPLKVMKFSAPTEGSRALMDHEARILQILGQLPSEKKKFFPAFYSLYEQTDHLAVVMDYFPYPTLDHYEKYHSSLALLQYGRQFFQFVLSPWVMITAPSDYEKSIEALRIIDSLLEPVVVLHHAGLVHKDLKPGNIFINDHGKQLDVKIIDFALASVRALRHQSPKVGTLLFSAPEQLKGTGQDNFTMDVYSVGIILHSLIASEMFVNFLHQYASFYRQSPTYTGAMPEAVGKILARAIARRPEDRYPDASSMRKAVQSVLSDLQSSPKPWSIRPGFILQAIGRLFHRGPIQYRQLFPAA